jgi:hypothetical protein
VQAIIGKIDLTRQQCRGDGSNRNGTTRLRFWREELNEREECPVGFMAEPRGVK